MKLLVKNRFTFNRSARCEFVSSSDGNYVLVQNDLRVLQLADVAAQTVRRVGLLAKPLGFSSDNREFFFCDANGDADPMLGVGSMEDFSTKCMHAKGRVVAMQLGEKEARVVVRDGSNVVTAYTYDRTGWTGFNRKKDWQQTGCLNLGEVITDSFKFAHANILYPTGDGQLVIANTQSAKITPVPDAFDFGYGDSHAISPDGKRVAWCANQHFYEWDGVRTAALHNSYEDTAGNRRLRVETVPNDTSSQVAYRGPYLQTQHHVDNDRRLLLQLWKAGACVAKTKMDCHAWPVVHSSAGFVAPTETQLEVWAVTVQPSQPMPAFEF